MSVKLPLRVENRSIYQVLFVSFLTLPMFTHVLGLCFVRQSQGGDVGKFASANCNKDQSNVVFHPCIEHVIDLSMGPSFNCRCTVALI